MEFSYVAQNAQKQNVEGTIEGPDKFAVARSLRASSLFPLSVRETKKVEGISFSKFFGKIKLHEKIVFTHNLAGMLTAGLTLSRALDVIKKQNRNPAFERVLTGVLATVTEGGTLSDALAKYPKIFSTLFVSMVRAGEESGNLSATLGDIGVSLEKSYDLNRKVKGAMMYPMVIVSAMVIIGILMLIFVVPTLTKVFTDMGTKLPPTTQFIITLSDAASHHPFLFVGTIGLVVGGILFLFRSPKMATFTDRAVLKLPVVGTIVKEVNTARTTRVLSSLLGAGVEMTRALTITEDIMQNTKYKEVLARAGEAVQKGGTLSSVFLAETKLYPVMMGEMIAVGEETGALTNMLADVAKYYEAEVDAKTKNLSTIVEPVLMVFIGGAVGFFAISIISPIYSLMNGIQ